ncbi:hypothetical protein JCM8097_008242 [Rhodosporidiobolus ruineniae]
MSTPADPFWPQVRSVWQHWSDLVGATQLAAARSGFVGLSRYWDARSASQVLVRCQSGTSRQDKRCYNTLVRSAACDVARPDGAYQVSHLHTEFCDAQRHPLHLTSSGLSAELKDPPEAFALSPGDELTGHRALHSLEAAVRVHARREGRFVGVTHDQAQGFAAVNLSSSSTKSRSSGSASSSAAKFPIPSDLTELVHAVKTVRKLALEEIEELERQKAKLEEMTDKREIEEASSSLITASRTFTSTSYAHLEALTAALENRLKTRDLEQWKKRQLENRMQELIDELL